MALDHSALLSLLDALRSSEDGDLVSHLAERIPVRVRGRHLLQDPYGIAQSVQREVSAILNDPSTIRQLTHVQQEDVGERADRTLGDIYSEARGTLDGLLAYLRDELSTLGPKVTRLAMGEDLDVGDFGKRTRMILFGLVLVASVIITVLAPPLGALAAIGHAIWIGTNVLCTAVAFAGTAQML